MKYRYFVSYFDTVTNGFGFGRCEVSLSKKIECIDDIKYLEEKLLKDKKEHNKLTILNYQLMKVLEKEVS